MRYRSSRNVLSFLGRLLRRVLTWRRPALVPVPVRRERGGLTIVEMLVTLAITLIMMGAVVNLFANIGQSVNDSRAAIEMSSMLRSARQLLQQDLAGATCPTLPWTRVDAGVGYFEIIEGPATDRRASALTDGDAGIPDLEAGTSLVPRAAVASDAETATVYQLLDHDYSPTTPPVDNLLTGFGDYDDILALTVRSHGAPFVGRFGGGTIESNLAEVIWFAVENPTDGSRGEPGMRTVYRRVLLIAPTSVLPHSLTPSEFFRQYDVSAHVEWDNTNNRLVWVPNSLSDLTKREYRFAHNYDPTNTATNFSFPHAIDVQNIRIAAGISLSPLHPFGYPFEAFLNEHTGDSDPLPLPGNPNDREGDDIVLTDALAFDIRVFDPTAPLINVGTLAAPLIVKPGDPVWSKPLLPTSAVAGRGAYVDLGYTNEPFNATTTTTPYRTSVFSAAMNPKSRLIPDALLRSVFDTWSFHYEVDGINQDVDTMPNGQPLIDEGTDGIDNPPWQFGVDDTAERETSPPYPVPLRSVEVRLRTYERDSRQVREVSVRQSFVPQ